MVDLSGNGFLQKEANKGLSNGKFYHSQEQAGLWSYGILNGFPPLQTVGNNFNVCCAKGLQQIGWTNLKKSGGGGISDIYEVRKIAIQQSGLWTKELEIMNPQVILLAFGAHYRLSNTVTDLLKQKWHNLRSEQLVVSASFPFHFSLWKINEDSECLIINFANVAARGKFTKWYDQLNAVFDELRQRGACLW